MVNLCCRYGHIIRNQLPNHHAHRAPVIHRVNIIFFSYWLPYHFLLRFLLFIYCLDTTIVVMTENDDDGNNIYTIWLHHNYYSFSIRSISPFSNDTPVKIYKGSLDYYSLMQTISAIRMKRF